MIEFDEVSRMTKSGGGFGEEVWQTIIIKYLYHIALKFM